MKTIPLLLMAVMIQAATAEARVMSRNIEYKHGGTKLEGYLAWDDSVQGKRPGVLVVPEWWGVNDYVRKRANMLAELGLVAFVADMYGRGKVTTDPKQAGEWASGIMKDVPLWRDRAAAGLDVLRKEPITDQTRLAAIGYCFGGSTVQQLAYMGAALKGIVSFHGNLVDPGEGDAERVGAKMLILHGSADGPNKPDRVGRYMEAMNRTSLDWRMIVYGGAKHSFTNPDSDRLGMPGIGYNKEADVRSWADMRAFFKEIF